MGITAHPWRGLTNSPTCRQSQTRRGPAAVSCGRPVD
jgi:hypothetical protein